MSEPPVPCTDLKNQREQQDGKAISEKQEMQEGTGIKKKETSISILIATR